MTIRTTELAELHVDLGNKPQAITSWHFKAQWGILVWTELTLKTAAILTALITLTTVNSNLKISLLRVVEECVIAPLVLGLFIPMVVAFSEKEIFSFVFTLCTMLAHLAVIGILLFGWPGFSIILFCGFMIVGEIYRLVFLDTTPKPAQYSITRRRTLIGYIFFYITLYLVVLTLETINVIDVNKGT